MSLVSFRAQNHRQQVGRRGVLDKVDDRRTPLELWTTLDQEFGFQLDAAASPDNALVPFYFTKETDALSRRWNSAASDARLNVWCNPPYSDIRSWVEKVDREVSLEDGPGCVVMLLPANRTEQAWWQDLIEPGRREGRIEVRFLRGRLRFDTPDHDYTQQPKGNRPPFGVCLVIWRAAVRVEDER